MATVTPGTTYVRIFEVDQTVNGVFTGEPLVFEADDPADIVVFPPVMVESPVMEMFEDSVGINYVGVVPVHLDNSSYPPPLYHNNGLLLNVYGSSWADYLHCKFLVVFATPGVPVPEEPPVEEPPVEEPPVEEPPVEEEPPV